jgi:Sec-independent protein translocase protein TatA
MHENAILKKRRNKMGIADDVKNLGEDIVASYNARVKAIGTIVNETRTLANNTHGMLKRFHAGHQEMSAKQAKDLADFMVDLTKNVGSLIKEFQKEHKNMAVSLKSSLAKNRRDIETYVKNKLQEFSAAQAEMSDELKKDLAKYVADIVNGTRELLGAFHDERERMGAHWQAMAATMAQKRGIKPVEAEAGADVKTVEKAVEKPKKRKPVRKPAKKG